MKASPLIIGGFQYPIVSVKANPDFIPESDTKPLAPLVRASVGFSADGDHFAILNVKQLKKLEPYTFELEAFTSFKIDVDACRECYANGATPSMLAVNVARLLYSGIRECLASITARAPHGIATLQSTTLGPEDVHIAFEPSDEQRDEILVKFFDYTPEKIDRLNERIAAAKASEISHAKPKRKVLKRLSKP